MIIDHYIRITPTAIHLTLQQVRVVHLIVIQALIVNHPISMCVCSNSIITHHYITGILLRIKVIVYMRLV